MRRPYFLTREKPTITIGIDKKGKKDEPRVFLDSADPQTLKRFHCPVCGAVAFEYYGATRLIIAGRGEPEVSAPIVVQCKSSECKALLYVES